MGARKNTENGECNCAVNGRIKSRTGIVYREEVVCAQNGRCFAENGLLVFPVYTSFPKRYLGIRFDAFEFFDWGIHLTEIPFNTGRPEQISNQDWKVRWGDIDYATAELRLTILCFFICKQEQILQQIALMVPGA